MTHSHGLALLLLVSLPFCASSEESAYNKAVDAYQEERYHDAFRLWSAAAAHGSVDALNNIGFLLYSGLGATQDHEAAVDLWRTAAYAGHSEAKWHLGEAYENGKGIPKDRTRAYAWYRCAVATAKWKLTENDDEVEGVILKGAEQSLQALTPLLTKADLVRGNVLATECIERYGRPAL